ncbi:MAG: outer membrane beta-barrel family protein [Bacteroides sp.]|nr:outer membrane beta-barrel family protein [Bacteroides sp.]
MKAKTWISLCVMLTAMHLSAQQSITGRILDNQQCPIPYANIVQYSLPDSAFMAGSVSDSNGVFILTPQQTEKCFYRISSIGYIPVCRMPDAHTTDMGSICLFPDNLLLEEVVIKANLPTTRIKNDALVTHIQHSILSHAGSAGDVLAKIPGIIKERDSYEVLGKGNPIIYINGRPVRDNKELEYLNSEDIKSVEVVTNPGARYDASVAAVVRIHTLRRIGDGFSLDVRSGYSQSQNVDLEEQVNVNYRHGGLDVFGQFHYSKYEATTRNDITHIVEIDSLWNFQNLLNGTLSGKTVGGEMGMNYMINDNHSFGFRLSVSAKPNTTSDMNTRSYITANQQFYDYLNNREYTTTTGKPSFQLNAYYNGTIKNWGIDFNADYITNHTRSRSLYDEASQKQESREVNTQSRIVNRVAASKLVFTHPLWGGQISAGGEYTHTYRTDEYSNNEGYIENTSSRTEEDGISGFAEYSRQSSLGNFTIGLRYEHTEFKYSEDNKTVEAQSRTYNNLFPAFSYLIRIGAVRTLLSYTVKTRRPTYSQLSNNLTYVDRFTMQQGNPLLEPCTIHDLSAIGTWRFLQLSLSYQRWRNEIMYWGNSQAGGNSVLMTYINYRDRPSLNITLSASPTIGIWSLHCDIGMQKQWISIDGIDFKRPRVKIRLGNTLDLGSGFSLGIDGSFIGKGHYQNLYQFKSYGTIDISLRKSFLKEALSLELRGNDVFHGTRNYWRTYFGNINWYQSNQWDTREFMVTLRYKFNSTKSKYKGTGAGNEELRRL